VHSVVTEMSHALSGSIEQLLSGMEQQIPGGNLSSR
jgi:hypothetical protein